MSEMKTDGTLRIGLIQMNSTPCDPLQNREKAERLIRKAAQAGADLVQLPETWNTGFSQRNSFLPGGAGGRGKPKAALLSCQRAASGDRGRIHLNPPRKPCLQFLRFLHRGRPSRGRIRQDTRILPFGRKRVSQAGGSLCCLDAGGMRAGVLLCYDLRFCEQARLLALQGAELLLVCAQWPRERLEHWRILTQARAIENQVFVSAVNGCGCFDGVQSGGGSLAVSPRGNTGPGGKGGRNPPRGTANS